MALKKYENEDFNKLIGDETLTLLDFYADWCGPCQMLLPVLDDLAQTREDVNFYKINVDEQKELAEKYSVKSIPTLILFKNGELIDQKQGYVPKQFLTEWIENNK